MKPAHECVNECARRGYRYAAVSDGGDCTCGNSYGSGGAANETECDLRCATWGAENCGGLKKDAVYLTGIGEVPLFTFEIGKLTILI